MKKVLSDQTLICPVDHEIKDIDDCFLTIHNLISIKMNDSTSDHDVKTYIYSATKPFLIELINNSTKDCLCCPNDLNNYLKTRN